MPKMWLSAHYHFPSTYSCKAPHANPNSANALPTPSPTTVRLALIRTALELYEHKFVQQALFEEIMHCRIRIQPPEQIALSSHPLRIFKTSDKNKTAESISYREHAHAQGDLIVSLLVDLKFVKLMSDLLEAIPYWGQANSFAICINVQERKPIRQYIRPLQAIGHKAIRGVYVAPCSVLDEDEACWQKLVEKTATSKGLSHKIYYWPLQIIEQRSTHTRLRRCSQID